MRTLALMAALLLGSCGPSGAPSSDRLPAADASSPAPGIDAAAATAPDPLEGMWHWATDNYDCGPNIQCRYSGTFMVVASTTGRNRYDITLNITQVMYPGSVIEQQAEAEQTCVGLRTQLRMALQCSVDRARYSNWTPVDFSFETNPTGDNLTGIMLDDPPVAISGGKL